MRKLSDIGLSERVEIVRVNTSPDLVGKLFSMDVRPGLRRKAPLGDPLEVKVQDAPLSIRSREASQVLVGG